MWIGGTWAGTVPATARRFGVAIFAMAAVALGCGQAAAQDLVYSDAPVTACLQAAGDDAGKRACIGLAADACMVDTPGGMSTAGMGGCLDRELAFWDDRLNAVYGRLRDQERAVGGDVANALRDMQRAWITFRDARCTYEASLWMGGTGQGPAALWCLLAATAEQALYLESNLR